MRLESLADILNVGEGAWQTVSGITQDSRKAVTGSLFFALAGTKIDGAKFAADAVEGGAIAVVCAHGMDVGSLSVPVIRVADPRLSLALCAARFYANQPETMIAVTGTAGKTSVAGFVRQIWAHAGRAAASIGTTGVVAPGRNDYGTLTTPDPVELHALLKDLADDGVTHASLEASSHGLDQHRLSGVKLSAGAFTNLGRDHLDYHATIEDYLNAKLRLFTELLTKGSPAVIFADDAFSHLVIDAAKTSGLQVLTVGRKGSFISLKRVEHERRRQRAHVEYGGRLYEIDLPLAGDFQIANALVSVGLAIVTGVPAATAFNALELLEGAPGRLDLVGQTKDGALLYVDYAHKPEALENVLTAVRPFTSGRVIVVFGCGGDRDKGKRPIMGEIAVRLADVVIVTDDNPRSEVPTQIRSEIMAAAKGAIEIGDRAQAIGKAVRMLEAGDTLIIAGKGHEEGQTIAGVTHAFSDHEEIRKAIGQFSDAQVLS
jgi:UDP-N-acetylmuramoyl-L-alanyl-D-glutamate--2,6-diaminopimelate ligase